jgi:hypothetical protein
MAAEINHPILGKLTWAADQSSWETKVELRPGCPIDLRITTRMDVEPTHNIDELLKSGAEMLEWAKRSESACRERIADELLELYNDTWAPEDAPAPMKRAEFTKRIVPSSLSRDIDGSGFFYWSDDDMFGGHWIELRFRKDYTISEVGLAG